VSIFLQKAEIKRKRLEYEDVGVQLYDMQRIVTKQQGHIDSYHETIGNISKIRQELEAQVETYKNTYSCEQQKLRTAQKKGYICHDKSRNTTRTITCEAHTIWCN
jgi:predicted RNase H-like nuclease (RuvC/YqgF family)